MTNYYNHQIAWKITTKLFNVHVKDVVTDWSYALAGFLVPTLFGVSPGNFSHCKCFSIRIEHWVEEDSEIEADFSESTSSDWAPASQAHNR